MPLILLGATRKYSSCFRWNRFVWRPTDIITSSTFADASSIKATKRRRISSSCRAISFLVVERLASFPFPPPFSPSSSSLSDFDPCLYPTYFFHSYSLFKTKMFASTSNMLLGASLLLTVSAAPVPIALSTLEARQELGVHVVVPGDTCFALAQQFGASLASLEQR
jgi:hypothetical protein